MWARLNVRPRNWLIGPLPKLPDDFNPTAIVVAVHCRAGSFVPLTGTCNAITMRQFDALR